MIEMVVKSRISHKCQYRRHRLNQYMCPCAVKLTQLIDFTRCASYDMSAMTNSAANVHILDCVSFEQSVWCSNGMGDKYSKKWRWELHLRVLSSSWSYRSGGWTCAMTVNGRQRRTHKYETVRAVLLVRICATSAHAAV